MKAPIEADYKTRKGEKTNRIDFDTVSTISKPHHVNGAAFSLMHTHQFTYVSKYILVLLTLPLVVDIIMVKIKIGGLSWRDYSKYERDRCYSLGQKKKFEIIIDGFRYIVKFQKNSEVGLTFNYVSEYLGSHIFQLIGIPVQETFLWHL